MSTIYAENIAKCTINEEKSFKRFRDRVWLMLLFFFPQKKQTILQAKILSSMADKLCQKATFPNINSLFADAEFRENGRQYIF